ncbi:MFS transporter [Arthrobacter sp. efr-133-R2A-120]|uniref:MFS transporter n=1 Tax=Arthrobacter sp. efr-133-R2A-120 TaxID=3040277 RepID=UPI00254EBE7A|nr:MFS transporter [Arthrobacter sp. efr-133-R2A-120]
MTTVKSLPQAVARPRASLAVAMLGFFVVALAAGPVLGGILTQLDWRLIFFVNLPVGVAALLILSRVAPSPRRPMPFDWLGQITAVLTLASLAYGVNEGAELGYGSPQILLTFAICVASAAVFVAAQARGKHPMIPLDLFRSRTVSTALIIAGVTMAAFYGVVFLQSLYFQQERGATALETGLLFLPMTGLVALLNPLVARFADRFGRIVAIVAGQLLMAAGLAGTASGAVNTARQLGGSLGVAIFGAALAGQDFMAGLRISLGTTALLLLVLVAVALPLRHAKQSRH